MSTTEVSSADYKRKSREFRLGLSMYLPNPFVQAGCDTRSIFLRRFEFKVFLLLDRLPYPYLPTPLLKQDMTQGNFLSGV